MVVNRAGQVVADGSNHVVANFDPTWHGEMEAIRNACAKLKSSKLDGCILYTSSEPCPMCLAAAYWACLDGIVYGATVADSKRYGGFDDGFIYEQIARPAARPHHARNADPPRRRTQGVEGICRTASQGFRLTAGLKCIFEIAVHSTPGIQ